MSYVSPVSYEAASKTEIILDIIAIGCHVLTFYKIFDTNLYYTIVFNTIAILFLDRVSVILSS